MVRRRRDYLGCMGVGWEKGKDWKDLEFERKGKE